MEKNLPPLPQSPLVTVAIPTKNRRDLLKRCLDALLKQSYANFEIVVVNDGSTDDTDELLEKYPVRVVRNSQSWGPSIARNQGTEKAKGDIVCYIDDDALPDEDWLAALVRRFSEEKDMAGVGGMLYDLDGETKTNQCTSPPRYWVGDRFTVFWGGNAAFRKDVLEKMNGFDEFMEFGFEEVDLCVRLSLSGYKLVIEPKAVVWHPERTGQAKEEKQCYYTVRNGMYYRLKNFTSINDTITILKDGLKESSIFSNLFKFFRGYISFKTLRLRLYAAVVGTIVGTFYGFKARRRVSGDGSQK
ncbi:MAG: glycosyltransferase family 2 protein [bacterium]|nr:glycosyltransferase family 2 protein [bacterium]